MLDSLAARRGIQARVAVRVNPDVDAVTHPYISTGLRKHKFGIDIVDAEGVYERAKAFKNLILEGVSCHIGSQILDITPMLEVFDSPDMLLSCARREQSTHAPQALELLNGDFSNSMARSFAERVVQEAGPRQDKQIESVFQLALGRAPTAAEKKAALRYLEDGGPLSEFALAVFLTNDFLYVN